MPKLVCNDARGRPGSPRKSRSASMRPYCCVPVRPVAALRIDSLQYFLNRPRTFTTLLNSAEGPSWMMRPSRSSKTMHSSARSPDTSTSPTPTKHPTTSSARIVIFASDSAPTISFPPAIPCASFSTCSGSGESHPPSPLGCVDGSAYPARTRPRGGNRNQPDSISASPQSRCPQRTGRYAGDSGTRTFLRVSANPYGPRSLPQKYPR